MRLPTGLKDSPDYDEQTHDLRARAEATGIVADRHRLRLSAESIRVLSLARDVLELELAVQLARVGKLEEELRDEREAFDKCEQELEWTKTVGY